MFSSFKSYWALELKSEPFAFTTSSEPVRRLEMTFKQGNSESMSEGGIDCFPILVEGFICRSCTL